MEVCQSQFSQRECLNLINEAICLSPSSWTAGHVEALPKAYVLEHISAFNLSKIWPHLSKQLQEDPDYQNHLPCIEHYNRPGDQYHIDGPPPPKYRCWRCLELKTLTNKAGNV